MKDHHTTARWVLAPTGAAAIGLSGLAHAAGVMAEEFNTDDPHPGRTQHRVGWALAGAGAACLITAWVIA
jgi:hypothetical protein